MKKNIILIVIAICVIVAGGFYFYNSGKNNEKKIEIQIENINKKIDDFGKSNDRSSKLETLKTTKDDFKKYKEDSKVNEKVEKTYERTINQMTKYFTDDYDKVETENTLSDVNDTPKEKIAQAETNLKDLVVTINNETGIVLEKNAAKERTEKIETTVATYESKITELDKKDKEAAAKKVDEEKAKSDSAKADGQMTNAIHYENEYFTIDVPENWRGKWSIKKNDAKSRDSHLVDYYNVGMDISGMGFGGGQEIFVLNPADEKNVKVGELTLVGRTSNGLGVYLGVGAGAGVFGPTGAQIAVK